MRDDLVGQRVATANQLRCLLEQFWPGAAEIFADVDSPIALEFLDRYPTPKSAASLGEKRVAAFMARHSYSGRRTAAELVQRIRSAPTSVAGELEAEAKGECVRALVAVLRPLVAQLATLSATIEHAVDAHPDGKIVTPLFRSGRICAAQLLAEIGDDRARFVSADHLAAEGGAAPVTRESGKHRAVTFRWACNMHLRRALSTLTDTRRHTNPWARSIYQRARDRGHAHPHAARRERVDIRVARPARAKDAHPGRQRVRQERRARIARRRSGPGGAERGRSGDRPGAHRVNQMLFAGDIAGAIRACHQALELYPGYVGSYRGLGLAYAQAGDKASALAALTAYVSAVPNAWDVALIKKRIARLQGK